MEKRKWKMRIPQRLKPLRECRSYSTAEAVPRRKADPSPRLASVPQSRDGKEKARDSAREDMSILMRAGTEGRGLLPSALYLCEFRNFVTSRAVGMEG